MLLCLLSVTPVCLIPGTHPCPASTYRQASTPRTGQPGPGHLQPDVEKQELLKDHAEQEAEHVGDQRRAVADRQLTHRADSRWLSR